MRSRRVDWSDVYITAALGCGVAFALFLLLSTAPARGQDPDIPANGAALLSAPIRSNFSTTNDRINDLLARFPGTTSINSIPSWSTSDGFLEDLGRCFFSTPGGVPIFVCNSLGFFQSYQNNSSFPSFVVDISGGSANIMQLRNSGTQLWSWSSTGALTTDLAAATQFNLSASAGLNWIGSGVSNDVMALNCTDLVIGDCLDIDEDGTQRLKLTAGGSLELTGTTVTPLVVRQAGTGLVSSFTTTTAGDDPILSRVQGRVAPTDATQTTILTIPVATSNVIQVECNIIGRVTVGANAGLGVSYKLIESFKNVAGTVTRLEGSAATAIESSESGALSAYDADIGISTTNAIVQVTGEASHTVVWHAHCEYSSVGS